jgi:hypothetical protein
MIAGRLSNTEIKRLARGILNRQSNEIALEGIQDRFSAESLRMYLEGLGAKVLVEETPN